VMMNFTSNLAKVILTSNITANVQLMFLLYTKVELQIKLGLNYCFLILNKRFIYKHSNILSVHCSLYLRASGCLSSLLKCNYVLLNEKRDTHVLKE
jgi:hypothetical protein